MSCPGDGERTTCGLQRERTGTLTAGQKEHLGSDTTDLIPSPDTASQAEGMRVLLSMAVGRAESLLDEIAVREGRQLPVPEDLAPDPGEAALLPTEPTSAERVGQPPRAGRAGTSGRHAAATRKPDRRGIRFMIFSTIGGAVFLMGLGLQAVLTGLWHVPAVVSYIVQAVASVETSFLLNRWLTWRDRSTPFWPAFGRFNAQKTVTIALNLALYAGLLRLGVNYLVANIVLTAVFTVVNYVAGDRLVFVPARTRAAEPAAPPLPDPVRAYPRPRVSIVIPCRNNERTIGPAVQSLLHQDYPGLDEIILVGSPGDHTWDGLTGIDDPRLTTREIETPPGVRDANFKRNAAIRRTSCALIALVDSDIVLPHDWMTRAVAALEDSGADCVTGGMRSVHDSFWGRYTDSTWIGAKTPRIAQSYNVTSADFGARGRKPPITANALFTRELYNRCPIDPSWSHGSYEDYEWFWRVAKAGYAIRLCRELFGWHHHRRGLRALASEYRRSSRGCAYFIRAHRDSPLAKRRLRQAILLPFAAIACLAGAATAVAYGYGTALTGLVLGCAALLFVHQVARSRSLESVAYPVVGLTLGLVFTTGLVANLIRSRPAAARLPAVASATSGPQPSQPAQLSRRLRILPLLAICAVQAALCLTFVWSNTAYVDEADNLWIGRLEIVHWLHGTAWPSVTAYRLLSGSPVIYPPLGDLAASIGGVAGARILSLAFMLVATILLYLTASRLIGRTGALFTAALWALSEPAMRLAFATPDPLSVLLTALSAWLVVQAGFRRRRGEFVAAAALALALANVTAYSGIVIDPLVIAFALLAWLLRMTVPQALSCAAWLAGAWALCFGLIMTASHSWPGLISSITARSSRDYSGVSSTLNDVWAYSGLILGLALIGAISAFRFDSRRHAALLAVLCLAAFLVPVAQLHDQETASIDKHLAYGVWFAVIAAGYGCSKFIRWLPGASRQLAALCCMAALAYPAASSWQSAWARYHAWPDAGAFINAFKPAAAQSHGLLYVPGREVNVAEYYIPQGYNWMRWGGALSLDPVSVPKNSWTTYYSAQLHNGNYGVIALFYSTTFSAVRMPGNILLSANDSKSYQELLGLVGINSGEPGLPALTQALGKDPAYHLKAVGPYNTNNFSGTHDYGIYAIWQKVQT
jgi:putative flippase GtrA/GT2 family glycosyltransferase